MADLIVDPSRFLLLGAVTDWLTVFRRHVQRASQPRDIASARKLALTRLVQLRWVTAPEIGYPTEPFRVWRRPALPMEGEKPVEWTPRNLFGFRILAFSRPQLYVRMLINSSGGGTVAAYAGAPFASAAVDVHTLQPFFQTVVMAGPAVQCVVLSPGNDVQSITGLDAVAARDGRWELVEVVGLPVGDDWSGVHHLDAPQGLAGALGDPRDAALDRFRRGAPFYGWSEQIAPTVQAPPWTLAEPKAMLHVMDDNMLEPLRQMVTTHAPVDQGDFTVTHTLPLVGGGGDPANAEFRPLQTLLFGAATDPLASLVSGFGTAFEDVDIPPISLGDRKLFGDPTRSDWDFMVTARYERGLDGNSDPVEYAAIVFAPGVAAPPPVPTNIVATTDGLRSPAVTDDDWRGVVRVAWDRLADTLPFRVGSYAFARAQQSPAGPVTALMDVRPRDTALQPISATTSPAQQALGRLQALDERHAIATVPDPNALLYAVAHQDLFGLWSGWSTAPLAIGEPPVQAVAILSTRLDVTPAVAGACPATLVFEFAWDWATRSPERIEFVGRLYSQARLGDPPPAGGVPAGVQTALAGGPGAVLEIGYGGLPEAAPTSGAPGVTATVSYLTLDGKGFEALPVATAGPRRYRVTVTGFALDFDAAQRIGLALYARAVEHRAPQRTGDWSTQPAVASAADPRPPVIVIEHEDVLLTSMADAAGLHHARLEWPAAAGAAGYFVYTTTETKLRADRGMPDAERSLTLSERLAALRDAFAANPDRRSFTRVNAQPTSATSIQVTLPRGSREIHLYVVLGASAGQVESAWPAPGDPALRKRPIAYAAPQVVLPSPPDLEVSRVLDASVSPPAFRAQLRVRSKPGAAVTRVDLHRVRVPEAAIALDTMGPPIARLTGSTAQFVVTPTTSPEPGVSQALGTITGRDEVSGSWKRVFYRAVAWAGDDPARGLYGGRSPASSLRAVVVPPADPPDLSPLAWWWPGGALGDAQVDFTTLAPLAETELGPHRLRVEVLAEHADGSTETLFSHPAVAGDGDRLDRLDAAPPPAGAHGVWRTDGAAAGQTALHLLARRASTDDRLRVRVLLTDPLGRATERLLEVPAGVPLPEPDIIDPSVVAVPGKGFLLTFTTTVPVPSTPIGPYVLGVTYTSRARLPLPPPFPRPRGLPVSVSMPLADIRKLRPLEDIFADPAAIPLRRSAAGQAGTTIAVALRGTGGSVAISLASPDGRTARLRRSPS